jgi:hypothetical protein
MVRVQEVNNTFFFKQTVDALAIADPQTEDQEQHLEMVRQCLLPEVVERVEAATKALTRYSILPGKLFATSPRSKEKYKVLRLVSNDVVVENQQTRKVQTMNIDRLLKDWSQKGLREIHFLDDIIETVKSILGPVLGVFLTGALVSWLIQKLSN